MTKNEFMARSLILQCQNEPRIRCLVLCANSEWITRSRALYRDLLKKERHTFDAEYGTIHFPNGSMIVFETPRKSVTLSTDLQC